MPPTTTTRRLLRSSSRNRQADDDDVERRGVTTEVEVDADAAEAKNGGGEDGGDVEDGKTAATSTTATAAGCGDGGTRRRSARRRTPRTLLSYDPSSLKPSAPPSAPAAETGLEAGAGAARSARKISGGKSEVGFGGKIGTKGDEEEEESPDVSLRRLRSIISGQVERARTSSAKEDGTTTTKVQAETEEVVTTCFPPTLFTDASYRRGVTLPVQSEMEEEDEDAYWEDLPRRYFLPADEVVGRLGCSDDYRYGPPPPGNKRNKRKNGAVVRSIPILTEREGRSWCHRHAATSSAARRFPFEAVRLLGTVTLNLEEEISVEVPTPTDDVVHDSDQVGGGCGSTPRRRRGKREKRGIRGGSFGGVGVIPPPPPRISLADVAVGPWRDERKDDDDDDVVDDEHEVVDPWAAMRREWKRRRLLTERWRWGGRSSHGGGPSSSSWRRTPYRHDAPRSVRRITPRAAHLEAEAELERHDALASVDGVEVEVEVERRAESIRRFWTARCDRGPSMECWDERHGGFADDALHHSSPPVADRSDDEAEAEEAPGDGGDDGNGDRGGGLLAGPRHVHLDVLAGWVRGGRRAGGVRRGEEETITFESSPHHPNKTTTTITGAGTSQKGKKRGRKGKIVRTSPPSPPATTTTTTTLTVSRSVRDVDENRTVSLYGGIREVPVDVKSVLDALLDLGDPRGLYGVPLLVPYAVAHLVSDDECDVDVDADVEGGGGAVRVRPRRHRRVLHWRVKIGVYVHRLLPEVLTCHHLHVVMSALDAGSYRVTKPIHLPPSRGPDEPPVFVRAPTPRVDMTDVRCTIAASSSGGMLVDGGGRDDGGDGGDHHHRLPRRGCGDGDYNEVLAGGREEEDDDDVIVIEHDDGDDTDDAVIVIEDSSDDEMSSSSSSSPSSSMPSSSAPASTLDSSLPPPPSSLSRRIGSLDGDGGGRGGGNDGNDAVLRASTREEGTVSPFSVRGLLKLLESTGNDVSNWPALEKVLAPRLRLSLMPHQRHAVCWMRQMENVGEEAFGINSILWEEREFFDGGRYYYSPALGQIRLGRPPKMRGGLLCDEMGLGKTIEVLGLIIATLVELRGRAEAENNDLAQKVNSSSSSSSSSSGAAVAHDWYLSTHATLIVVPPALVMQWTKEVEKTAGNSLNVAILNANSGLFDTLFFEEDVDDVDGVIVKSDVIITTYESLVSRKTAKLLASVKWGRIVLDEMQEIRSSTTQISKNCEKLNCDRRWMLSGTPLFDGIEDLRGELNFLRLEPYGAKFEDGFFDFSVTNHWEARTRHGLETLRILGMLMLRRSKDMTLYGSGMPILGLKPLMVEYVPVMQTESERALYCWMEYLVSRELNRDKDDDDSRSRRARAVCIRLLRELCVTPVLLNGGLGVPSQLDVVNRLMVNLNRREEEEDLSRLRSRSSSSSSPSRRTEGTRVFSCDRALRFLTQAQHDMRTEDDFESDLVFGGGGGVTNRNLAHDSAEMKYNEAETEVREATEELAAAKKKKARLRWHLALERLTTGRFDRTVTAGQKFRGLWRLRSAFIGLLEREHCGTAMPSILTRGWRPSPSFLRRDLYASRPEFAWAHPIALMINNIPTQVTEEELQRSLHLAALRTPKAEKVHGTLVARLSKELSESNMESGPSKKARIDDLRNDIERAKEAIIHAQGHDEGMKKPAVVKMKTSQGSGSTHWRAVVHFNDEEDARNVALKASKMNGISLQSEKDVPYIEKNIEAARDKLCQIESINKVHPSRTNQQKETEARKLLAQAELGLRILLRDKDAVGHVILSRPNGPFRSVSPRTASALVESTNRALSRLNEKITNAEIIVARGKQVMERLLPALNRDVPEELVQTTAFGILEALSGGELEKTQCSICLCPLGTGQNLSGNQASISMIKCGHFFCVGCLNHHVQQRVSSYQNVNCPNCRRPFSNRDVVHIDHRLKNEQELLEAERIAARAMVEEASKMLERSNGQLSPKMWRSLFLAFGFPEGVSQRAHPVFTAVPREVLAHLRAATGMDIHNSRNDAPDAGNVSAGRSSKVQALLADLPRTERSVVFTTTKDTVKHLVTVMMKEGIGCHALFTGQLSSASEQAVISWEAGLGETEGSEELPCPVLVIQAGAATSGLTLTAASKIFLMEPFLRQEEEQQAFARCHRYGQKNEVHVKCYFTPVSVESRLLEWRKMAQSSTPGIDEVGTKVFVRDVVDEKEDMSEDSEDETESEIDTGDDSAVRDGNEDVKQSMFLLGLME